MDELVSLYSTPRFKSENSELRLAVAVLTIYPPCTFLTFIVAYFQCIVLILANKGLKKCTAQKYVFLKRKQFLKNNCFKTIKIF